MNESWELRWVSDEEDWGVVVDPVQVTLLGVELGGETSWVSVGVWGTLLTTNSGESGQGSGTLTDGVEHGGTTDISYIVGNLEVTESTPTTSVWLSLWDVLSVEVSNAVDEVVVLQQQWTVLADPLSGKWLIDDGTGRGGDNSV